MSNFQYLQYLNILVSRMRNVVINDRTTRVPGYADHAPKFVTALNCGPFVGHSPLLKTKKLSRTEAARSLVTNVQFLAWVEENAVRPMPATAEGLIPQQKEDIEAIQRRLDQKHREEFGTGPHISVCEARDAYNCMLAYGDYLITGHGKTVAMATSVAYANLDRRLVLKEAEKKVVAEEPLPDFWRTTKLAEDGQVADRQGEVSRALAADGLIAVTGHVQPNRALDSVDSPVHYQGMSTGRPVVKVAMPGEFRSLAKLDEELLQEYAEERGHPLVIMDHLVDEVAGPTYVRDIQEVADVRYVYREGGVMKRNVRSEELRGYGQAGLGYAVLPTMTNELRCHVCFISRDPTVKHAAAVLRRYGKRVYVLDSERKMRLWLHARKGLRLRQLSSRMDDDSPHTNLMYLREGVS